jgi:3-polyprenyl-4-hydroxybenzoate decarboxylase
MVAPPLDFQEHLARLDAQGLLRRIERAVNKDIELHPLVRWQFQGGLKEDERRAFLFTNVVDSTGRRYDTPVAIGALASSAQIYAVGMGCAVEQIGDAWMRAIANPIAPVTVTTPRHISPRPCASRRIPRPASATWAPTARSSKPPTGSACAWRRASAAPAAICIGRNTAS